VPARPYSRLSVWAPRLWGIHVFFAAAVVGTSLLGWWQLDAWQSKREAESRDLTKVEPQPLREVLGPDQPFPSKAVGQPVVLSGTWVPSGTVTVTGRERDGVPGSWVVTPLEVGPDHAALLVVRGWLAKHATAPPPPMGQADLVAWLQPPEGSAGISDDNPDDNVLPQLRIPDALRHVDQDLYGAYAVVADKVAPGVWPVGDRAVNPGTTGLEQADLDQLPDIAGSTALRNLLYALEWWVFGGFGIYLWWRIVRDLTHPEDADDEESPATA